MTNTIAKIEEFALPKDHHVSRVVYICLIVLALSVSMYVYFVGKIVFDVVARRTAEASIRHEQSAVGNLEVEYFKELQSLNHDVIARAGLIESHDTLYATRDAAISTAALFSPSL